MAYAYATSSDTEANISLDPDELRDLIAAIETLEGPWIERVRLIGIWTELVKVQKIIEAR